jgi:hypothetical protein
MVPKSVDEQPVREPYEDLIKLLRINQHSAFVIDGNRRIAVDGISVTKERIRAECAMLDYRRRRARELSPSRSDCCCISNGYTVLNQVSIGSRVGWKALT